MRIPSSNHRLAPAATALSLFACYGTLAVIALPGTIGVSIALDDTARAAMIVVPARLAMIALYLGWRDHRGLRPIVASAVGVAGITFAMLERYGRILERAGLALLCIGSALDWRARHGGGRGSR